MRLNPTAATTPISILRDLTLEEGGSGIVARFDAPVPLYRAIDGTELALAFERGRFEGGVFSTPQERRWGASWATASAEDVAQWAASWAERGRIGEDLFVVVADGEGYTFYREGGQMDLPFDPDGRSVQDVDMPLTLCGTGLGCSVTVNIDDEVHVLRVLPDGTLEPMSLQDVEQYVEQHPVPDVNLRNFGFGTEWYGGTLLGESVVVGRDQEDGLWLVKDREDRPFVVGARSKAAAIREAKQMIREGRFRHEVSWLNRIPVGFEEIQLGDRFRATRYPRFEGEVQRLGASYAVLRGRRPRDTRDDFLHLSARELMRDFEPVDFTLREKA